MTTASGSDGAVFVAHAPSATSTIANKTTPPLRCKINDLVGAEQIGMAVTQWKMIVQW